MKLTEAQSRELLRKHGTYLTEACDKCGRLLTLRFTRRGEDGVWCSRLYRDGKEREFRPRKAGRPRLHQDNARKQKAYRTRQGKDRYEIPSQDTMNKPLTDAFLGSGYGGSRTVESHA